ncbi:SAM-dependent methyltransferase [Caloramator sp. CAR-1]|uniref:class I SAM-dependent methyltransferase n=1 Tax=Caloramator sp. CAR-1 TaxID=3062777 RepID=UPI0026E420EE|nr:SAM-dependent methyltransferase [Caloramator sp. CAR-1]MDO6353511.1 SAM-dependent methyltransferase [Caloramator sp. CAR-1]
MNKQTCEKIKFMLSAIIIRAEENSDFIKGIDFTFKSGGKEFKGVYDIDKNMLCYNGQNLNIKLNDLRNFIADESIKYDSLELRLLERGKTTILSADNKNVKIKNIDEEALEDYDGHERTGINLKRSYYIKIGEADDLLKAIGILTKDGKLKNDMIRKYNQIDHFVELIDSYIDEFQDYDTINVLDCACGKSYLTFVLNYYIKEKKKKNCFFIGIDTSEVVIENSKKIAKELGYKNMMFIKDNIKNYNPDRRIDIVISLHACDIATDMALGAAINFNAKAIFAVPCCHRELLEQIKFDDLGEIFKHGILKARFSDLLTDGIRGLLLEAAGYKVSIVEYISPLETPKNLLIRALKLKDKDEFAWKKYEDLKKRFCINPYLEKYVRI